MWQLIEYSRKQKKTSFEEENNVNLLYKKNKNKNPAILNKRAIKDFCLSWGNTAGRMGSPHDFILVHLMLFSLSE